jgi:cytochrome c oxidase subunit 2
MRYRRTQLFFFSLLTLLLTQCASAPSTLNPQGPAAARIATLWWILFGVGAAVYVVVMGLLLGALFLSPGRWRRNGRRLVIIGGLIVPTIILVVVYGFTLTTLSALSPTLDEDALTIEVIGHQWWWEVRYPEQQVVTANEIHIPVGQQVTLKLTSADVIHSFWVPELHGKRDLIPGRVNDFWLQADEAGDYWGLCAEFCGTQHAKMLFVLVAEPPEMFEQWVAAQQTAAAEPTDTLTQQGFDIFMEAECGTCHQIRGTPASGDFGPDLTHFASRLTLGAGAARNTRGTLAGWVVDPHGIKPGNLMPSSDVSGKDLQPLLAYLESLE